MWTWESLRMLFPTRFLHTVSHYSNTLSRLTLKLSMYIFWLHYIFARIDSCGWALGWNPNCLLSQVNWSSDTPVITHMLKRVRKCLSNGPPPGIDPLHSTWHDLHPDPMAGHWYWGRKGGMMKSQYCSITVVSPKITGSKMFVPRSLRSNPCLWVWDGLSIFEFNERVGTEHWLWSVSKLETVID